MIIPIISKNLKRLSAFLLLIPFLFSTCNPVKHLQGDEKLSFLEGKEKIGIEFDYSETTVGDLETSEDEFLEKRIKEKNEEEAGSGDEWAEQWQNDKTGTFHPDFIEKMNKWWDYKLDGTLKVVNDPEMEERLVIKVERIEPGFYGGVVEKDAELDTKMLLIEDGNKDSPKTILGIKELSSPSGPFDKSSTRRLGRCYEESGHYYAQHIAKKLSK